MPRQNRQKKSTAKNMARTFDDAEQRHTPPIKLTSDEEEVFHAIVSGREWDTWSDNDLFDAAHMAKMAIQIEFLIDLYEKEGPTVEGATGATVVNPTFTVYTKMVDKYVLLKRTLGLSASQKGVAGKSQRGRNIKQTQAKRKLASVSPLLS